MLESIASAGPDVVAVASAVYDWAVAHPHIRITGGTGVSYPSFNMALGLGRSASSSSAVLSLYGTPGGDRPMLEVRIRQMLATPPYDQDEAHRQLIADLRSVGIPRLDVEGCSDQRAAQCSSDRFDQRAGGSSSCCHRSMDQERPGKCQAVIDLSITTAQPPCRWTAPAGMSPTSHSRTRQQEAWGSHLIRVAAHRVLVATPPRP